MHVPASPPPVEAAPGDAGERAIVAVWVDEPSALLAGGGLRVLGATIADREAAPACLPASSASIIPARRHSFHASLCARQRSFVGLLPASFRSPEPSSDICTMPSALARPPTISSTPPRLAPPPLPPTIPNSSRTPANSSRAHDPKNHRTP